MAFYTDNPGTSLRIAQVIGLTTTSFLAGKTFVTSFATVPALLQAPAPLLAKQWKKQFDADKLLAPAIAIFSSGIFAYISCRDSAWTRPSILYASSSLLMAALVPYTYLLGEPLNKQLEEKAAGTEKGESTHSLVDKWATVNFGRFVISAVSAVLATYAAVDRTEVVPAAVRLTGGANRMG